MSGYHPGVADVAEVVGPDGVAFFALVDELLTPAMTRLGYHRIGGFRNDQPSSREANLLDAHVSIESMGSSDFLWLDFGFEAGSDAVAARVDPTDPDSADELWLSYEPATGTLELDSWAYIAQGRVSWDVRRDSGPCTPAEVGRRLSDLARAVDESDGSCETP